MLSMLDVNVIIALIDPEHTLQDRVHEWWAANRHAGWASCPITENGAVRIMSNPNYRQNIRFAPSEIISSLNEFIRKSEHQFWNDEISILDDSLFDFDRIHGPKQLTDLYLLALATKNKGRLVTFDQGIPLSVVKSAKAENLVVL